MAKKPATTINIEEDAAENQPVKSTDLAAITSLAEEMRGIQSWFEEVERRAKLKKERYDQIEQQLLPDLMSQAGMTSFNLRSGETVNISDFVRASIPSQTSIDKAEGPDREALEARRTRCFAWLKKHGGEALIKAEVTAVFGKGQTKAAEKIVEQIVKKGYPARLEQAVNFQTLNKFVRDNLQAGVTVPEDDFGLFTGKVAKISKPKAKK